MTGAARYARVPGLRGATQRLARRGGPLVVFDSWRGAYSDNPRAVSEALRRLRPELPQAWVATPAVADLIPSWADQVRPASREHLRALGAATHVVTNLEMPSYFAKRSGTSYVQTWHGTPLKRLAFDVVSWAFAPQRRYQRRLAADVRKWDVLLSPNPFSTEIFRQAFRYGGPVLESGYPRNDLLSSPEAPAVRDAVRRQLGVGGRAVLYAPTWRDAPTFELGLDLASVRAEGTSLLLRSHHKARIPIPPEHAGWVIDVTDHPDIRELYLAADVLVTDYSSAMFDFAVTGKPLLFFTYDLAHYRDELRGLYFDLREGAPGPLLETSEELAAALTDLDAVSARHAGAYQRFAERFCALEDGRSAERVVDALF